MKKRTALNTRLLLIVIMVFIPMAAALAYSVHSLIDVTTIYSRITESITYANDSLSFKESMDYSAYLAVVRKESFREMVSGEVTVNGIVTVNPYDEIEEMKERCENLSSLATVEVSHNQITRLYHMLNALKKNIQQLETMIKESGSYEDNKDYLDENIYMVTTVIEEGLREYIHLEIIELQKVSQMQEKENRRIQILCILIALLAIYAAAVMTMWAFRSITIPIKKICDLTKKVSEGDFSVQEGEADILEIQVLSDNFSNMTEKIGTLVEHIKEKEKNLHLMETRLLQEQINPHFLYNTLDAIIWLAEDKRNCDVIEMVTSLSDFFRTTLAQGRDFVSVREEKTHIESYLRIQGFRYQDILDYSVDMESDIAGYIIPKLLLQPLVENALYHGVKNKRGRSRITVWGYSEGDELIFKIIDNGKGMNQQTLFALRKNITRRIGQTERDESFGLANVNQRIKYYYGEEYGLEIESEENVGTEATIRLPKKNIPLFKDNKQ